MSETKRQIPELLASLGESGFSSQYLPLSHSICCKLCLGIFNHAKVLPCLHSFCLSCLQVYARKSTIHLKDRNILCPTCQEYFKLPGTGIKGLLDNTLIDQSIKCNVPTLALRRKEEPLFPGLYSTANDSYEVFVKRPDHNNHNIHEMNGENKQWKDFIERQKSTDDVGEGSPCDSPPLPKPLNISEALKGLSDEERLERLTNSLKNTFSFSQALQDHDARIENQIHALRTPSSCSEYSFTQRDFLQEQLANLQTEAMQIIYRLDNIKRSGDTWERNRARVEQQIHGKVDQIIAMARKAERQLLNKIDSFTENQIPTNQLTEARQKLQLLLKNILGVIDFIRLVLSYGRGKEVELYEQLIGDRCEHLFSNTVTMDKTEVEYLSEPVIEDDLENLIGQVIFKTVSEEIWKFKDNEVIESSDSVFEKLHDTSLDRKLPPSFSREFLESIDRDGGYSRSYTPDSLGGEEAEQQRLTVDQLIHKFSTEFGMRYNEILASDSSSTPMTSSVTSDNPCPSPIPEETNGNGLVETEFHPLPTRHRPRSHKRRHTVSDVQQDLAHARIDLSDNRYRGLVRSRKASIPDMLSTSLPERPLSNDIEQTKRMLALCKRQLLEAKSMGVYHHPGASPQTSALASPEHRMSRSHSLSHDSMSRSSTGQHLSRGSPSREPLKKTDHADKMLSRSLVFPESASQPPNDQRLSRSLNESLTRSSEGQTIRSGQVAQTSQDRKMTSEEYIQSIRKRIGLDKPGPLIAN